MQSLATFARKALTIVVAALFIGLTLLPAIQIVLRLIGMPFIGAEELTRFFLICMIFLSYPLVVAAKENIVMGELKNMLPAGLRRFLEVLIELSATVLSFYVSYAAYHTVMRNLKNATPTLQIPFWLFLGSTLVAFLLAGFIHLSELYAKLFRSRA
ncbi:MAG: TRAP transporter small permease [Planctomycetaceae bacterium]|nr:TRAP transporter small permease [Planctomycetaceae bacterium]